MTTNNRITEKKRLIIVGGGFAGLNLCLHLYKKGNYEITLIDKNNYNYFTPLLYQVATSFLDPSSISYPFRQLFRNKDIGYIMDNIDRIDTVSRSVFLSDGGEVQYDELVFAAGAKTNFFGNKNIEENAISIKGIPDALSMKNALLVTLEKASLTEDPQEARTLMTIVVAGGGPTGVEVAGMLAEMKKNILHRDYPKLKQVEGELYIVDGGPNLLAPMSEKTHRGTEVALRRLGVKILMNTRVSDFSNQTITFTDGSILNAGTLIWSAGITANKFDGIPQSCLGPGNRMMTDEYNRVTGIENVWAIGDISIQMVPSYPLGHPQLAQVAIQQGRTLAKNLIAQQKGKQMTPFGYFDKGVMAIVGRHSAVVDLFKNRIHLSGFTALVVWLFIHVVSLVTYNNKMRTLYNWILAYFLNDQSLRMIFKEDKKK